MVKQEVLAALDGARGQYISGQELAARLGVSRTAIWKAVAALRSDGIPIEAVTNRGYTLSKNVDVLNTAAGAALLREYAGADEEKKKIITEIFRRLAVDVKDELVKAAGASVRRAGESILATGQAIADLRK